MEDSWTYIPDVTEVCLVYPMINDHHVAIGTSQS